MSILTLSFAFSVSISKLDTFSVTFTLYSYTFGENDGVRLYPFIDNFFKSDSLFLLSCDTTEFVVLLEVVFSVAPFLPSSLVTFIVYVLVVPSSAVTITFSLFFPTFNF